MKRTSEVQSLVVWSKVLLVVAAVFVAAGTVRSQTRDLVAGNLIQFNDNGFYCWYQDERAVVDTASGNVIVGIDQSGSGLGGSPRDGEIDAVFFNLQIGSAQKYVLSTGRFGGDDHNAPGLLVRPDGKYLAMYTGHNANSNSYWRVYDPGAGTWGSESNFDWMSQPGGTDFRTTYSNLRYLSKEGRVYNFSRGNGHGGQNIMVSTNQGNTWSFGGTVFTNGNVGYVNGYFKYWDNGTDRIDFICTEYHPRDYNTSIYHGYISNGMTFKTGGTLVDTNIFDKKATPSASYSVVFAAGTVKPPGQTNYRCWNSDVCRYPDGTIQCIITARINNNSASSYPDTGIDPNHAFFFCRYDGTNWTSTYLCQAGKKLFSDEGDYVGLGCLSPNDPNTIYISTPYDPRTDTTNSTIHEIWKGVTSNHGANFTWTPITRNSVRDNLRPIVPAWNATNTALVWFRGTYSSSSSADEAPVGLLDRPEEVVGQMHYVDATTNNTFLTNGTALVLSSAANRWHSQTGVGNGGTILSSSDSSGENATNLMTQVTVPGSGTYDVWINFWGNPAADWRIRAGLTVGGMQTYRSEKCKEVEAANYANGTSLVLTNTTPTNNYLYQAYVGRVVISNNYTINVLVDDNAIQTGGTGTTLTGNTCRTWYDGVSYARVNLTNTPPTLAPVGDRVINAGVTLLVTNMATDPDVPPETLAFSLPSGPTNATLTVLNATSAIWGWRPLVSQANTTNSVSVVVEDDGSPSLSATNNFSVIVNPLAQSALSLISVSGVQINLGVDGPVGPDYTLKTTTNLVAGGWQTLYATNSPLPPLTLVVTNLNDPVRFYRIQLGP